MELSMIDDRILSYLPLGVQAILEDEDQQRSVASWLCQNVPVRAELWEVERGLNSLRPLPDSRFFDIVLELHIARGKFWTSELDRHRRAMEVIRNLGMSVDESLI
jgi:hypothetical protein